ncbi:hypothetical protein ACFOET_07970 [Parapedobacter deserti]|uniref:Uncharacterized protein n=1 Tax=Parapedobacter deserti TaxID=1912957 RepID=A0ABV7JQG7_9SPHI
MKQSVIAYETLRTRFKAYRYLAVLLATRFWHQPNRCVCLPTGVALAVVLPKGEPCTCEDQLDPEWVAALQHQRKTDYDAFFETRGTVMLCAAQWLQLKAHLERTNPILQTHQNSIQ